LSTGKDKEERATENRRQIPVTLDQSELNLHTVQNEKAQLELQKQNENDFIRDAAKLVRVYSQQQQQQQID